MTPEVSPAVAPIGFQVARERLRLVGLHDPVVCRGRGRWAFFARPGHALAKRLPFDGAFLFTDALETYVVALALGLPPRAAEGLLELGLDTGSLTLKFWERVPDGYARGCIVTSYHGRETTIASSTTVAREIHPPQPSAGLQRLDYHAYLDSTHWAQMRREAFAHYGKTCVLCGSAAELQVHHRTYARVGREFVTDLIVLCDDCHAGYHGKRP